MQKWHICGQNVEVIYKLKYLGITSEISGGYNRQIALLEAKINQALIIIDNYLSRTPNMEVQTL
jgi:hypothetical protein